MVKTHYYYYKQTFFSEQTNNNVNTIIQTNYRKVPVPVLIPVPVPVLVPVPVPVLVTFFGFYIFLTPFYFLNKQYNIRILIH